MLTHLHAPRTPEGLFCFLPGTRRPPIHSAAHGEVRVRSGFARALALRAHTNGPSGARRWQVRAHIRVPAYAWRAGASGASRTAYLPTERVKRASLVAKNNAWLLRYIFTSLGASSRTRTHAHALTLIAREFVGCLSDKLKKVIDRMREICYIVAVF